MQVVAVGTTHPCLPAHPSQLGWLPRMAQLHLCLPALPLSSWTSCPSAPGLAGAT